MSSTDIASLPPVTLILFAYNQSHFIAEAAASCLAQDYAGPLEILLSDDSSTDDTFSVLQRLADAYSGPHTVRARRNPVNQGIGGHYNTAIAEAKGDLIFTAAGDDISLPSRVRRVVDAWITKDRKADLLTSNLQRIDEHGSLGAPIVVADLSRWQRPEDWIRKRPYVVGAAHAFTPRLHRHFGDFIPGLVYEDQVMAMRAAMAGGGLKVDEVLVLYREGGVSQTKSSIQTADDYLNWARKNFARQAAQYQQIHQDLLAKNRPELMQGKLLRKLRQAELVVELDRKSEWRSRLRIALNHCRCGLFFTVKMGIYLSFPAFSAFMQRLQQKLKRK